MATPSSTDSILVQNNGTTPVATNTFTDANTGTKKHMQVSNLYDVGGNDAMGAASTGVTPQAGGSGMLGFLSSIYKALTGTLAATISNFPAFVGPCVNQNGTGQWTPIADAYAEINFSTNGTFPLISPVANKQIIVTGWDWIGNSSAGGLQFVQTGSNTPITGTYPIVANEGLTRDSSGGIWKLPVGVGLSVIVTAGANVQGSISYTAA